MFPIQKPAMQRCYSESIILLTYIYLGLLFHGSAGMHRLNVLPECSDSSAYCLKYPGEIDRKNTPCLTTEGILLFTYSYGRSPFTKVRFMRGPALTGNPCTCAVNFFTNFIVRGNTIVRGRIAFDCGECSIVVNHNCYLISNVVSVNKIPPFILLGINFPGRTRPILKSVN